MPGWWSVCARTDKNVRRTGRVTLAQWAYHDRARTLVLRLKHRLRRAPITFVQLTMGLRAIRDQRSRLYKRSLERVDPAEAEDVGVVEAAGEVPVLVINHDHAGVLRGVIEAICEALDAEGRDIEGTFTRRHK